MSYTVRNGRLCPPNVSRFIEDYSGSDFNLNDDDSELNDLNECNDEPIMIVINEK